MTTSSKSHCVVCGADLTARERLYCSRRCNHKAWWARHKLAKAKALATELEENYNEIKRLEATLPPPVVASGYIASDPTTAPSPWQRLRKRLGDMWATAVYLFGDVVGN